MWGEDSWTTKTHAPGLCALPTFACVLACFDIPCEGRYEGSRSEEERVVSRIFRTFGFG
jgi:hypothetical protein